MAVIKIPREKMPSRTSFFFDGMRDLRSMGKGVNILKNESVAASSRFCLSTGGGTNTITSKIMVMEAMLV